MKPIRLAVIASLVGVLIPLQIAWTSPAAKATVPSVGPLTSAEAANQSKLVEFFGWLAQGSFGSRGYVAPEQDAANLVATLRWKDVGDADKAVVTAEAARRGIAVAFKATPYSSSELTTMAQRLMQPGRFGNDFEVTRLIGVPGDTVIPQVIVRSLTTQAIGAAKTQRDSTVVQAAGGTVTVEDEQYPAVALSSRGADTSPYNAGGMIRYNTASPCSTGFALYYGGANRATTARHCDGGNYRTWDTGLTYGFSLATSSDGGAKVLSGSGMQLMFTGSPTSTVYRSVYSYSDPGLGTWVCTSGANTGEHCNLLVNQMSVFWNDGYGPDFSTIGAQEHGGGVAAGQADSGGPVFFNIDGTGTGRLGAAGMIQWGSQSVPCGTTRVATTCYNWVYFSSIRTIARNLGAKLVTSQGLLSP